MGNFGIKVVKTGASIDTTDVRDILMSSKYSMLKYHSDNTNSITFNSGETNKYIDFSHDLGYVPAFISYVKHNNLIYNINTTGGSQYGYSWADSSKVRCGFITSSSFWQTTFSQTAVGNINYYDAYEGLYNFIVVGQKLSHSSSGALRFTSVTVPKNATIISATLSYVLEYKGTNNGDIKIRTRGIDEDNTGDFSSDPMGRSGTDAYTDNSANQLSNSQININVASQVGEITSRSGWGSGNAMGFTIRDNGTSDGMYGEDDQPTGANSSISIIYQTGNSFTVDFRTVIFKDKIA